MKQNRTTEKILGQYSSTKPNNCINEFESSILTDTKFQILSKNFLKYSNTLHHPHSGLLWTWE